MTKKNEKRHPLAADLSQGCIFFMSSSISHAIGNHKMILIKLTNFVKNINY